MSYAPYLQKFYLSLKPKESYQTKWANPIWRQFQLWRMKSLHMIIVICSTVFYVWQIKLHFDFQTEFMKTKLYEIFQKQNKSSKGQLITANIYSDLRLIYPKYTVRQITEMVCTRLLINCSEIRE